MSYPSQGSFYGNNPYQKPRFVSAAASKSSQIEKFQKNKNAQIQTYTDNKEASIIVTSSINNASDWCISHPDWSKEMTDAERMTWIDEVAKQFIAYFADNRDNLSDLYWSLKREKDERKSDALAEGAIDFGQEE